MKMVISERSWKNRISRSWNLLWALVYREITSRYRRSVLGPLWAIIQPLILMVVFTIIRNFMTISSDGQPYVLFSYAALIPWQFFSTTVARCGSSIRSNSSILKKISLAREVFPLTEVITALFDMAMSGIILAGMMLYYHVQIGWTLMWLPVLIGLLALLAFSIGIFIAALGTFRNDFVIATPFFLQVWFYATPIVYPLSSVPERWRTLYMLNPAVGIIEGFRSVLLKSEIPDLKSLGFSLLMTLLILILSWPMFRRLSQYFADVL